MNNFREQISSSKKTLSTISVAVILLVSLAPFSINVQNASAASVCIPPPSGMISWWPGDGNANDIKDGNNGVTAGGLTFSAGEVKQAFNFDGTDDSVKITKSTNLNVGSSAGLTIDAWINPSIVSSPKPIVEWNNGVAVGPGAMRELGAHLWISVTNPGGTTSGGPGSLYANIVDTAGTAHFLISPSGTITQGSFQHVGLTFDKTTGVATLYKNGQQVAQKNLGTFTPQTSYDLYLGLRPSSPFPGEAGTRYFGLADEVELHNRVLTQAEIQSIYDAGSAGKCKFPAPTANAGADQTVNEGNAVSLVGTASTPGTGGSIDEYKWEQTAGPTVTLSGANTATATFTAPSVTANTDLTFKLTVTDFEGGTSSDTIVVTDRNVNQLPVADAGADFAVDEGTSAVQLQGSGTDSDGTISSYLWEQTSGPSVTLSNTNSATATFDAPSVATGTALTFQLIVTDNDGATASDTVDIVVNNVNQLPTADAGQDQTVNEGDTIGLDGSASTDSDGTIQSYSWGQTAGTPVTLDGETSATPSFTAPNVGSTGETLSFELTVTDNDGATATDAVNITVENVNQLPTADAGPDSSVNEGTTGVQLDGTGSTDPDGTIVTHLWEQTSGPSVTLSDANSATPTFDAPNVESNTDLTFKLTVSDNDAGSASDIVQVTVRNVNQNPIADAGDDQTVNEGDTVNLDGSTSSDPDGTITSYAWSQTVGTAVTLSDSASSTPSFVAPSVGSAGETLSFELKVTDNDGGTAIDSVVISVQNVNQLPTADAGSDDSVNEGAAGVQLDGTGSSDSDGTIDTYLWEQTDGPSVTLSDAGSPTASFDAPSVETNTDLTFRLTVNDNDGGFDTDTVTITVNNVNQEPTAALSANPATINEGQTSALDASGSNDPDSGDTLTYTFAILNSGPGTITGQTDANDPTVTYNAPSDVSSDQTITIQVTVEDGNGGSDTKTVNILVKNVSAPTQYAIKGFYAPVDMKDSDGNPIVNTIKSGQSVGMKFEVFDNSNVEQTSTSIIQSFKQNKISCTTLQGDPQDAIEATNTGGTQLRYDTTGGTFIQNWKTPSGQAGNCYSATVTTVDGSSITAYFKFK